MIVVRIAMHGWWDVRESRGPVPNAGVPDNDRRRELTPPTGAAEYRSGGARRLIQPFESGLLKVRDGSEIYWETTGNPRGVPLAWLHGGPGFGLMSGGYRRVPDPRQR